MNDDEDNSAREEAAPTHLVGSSVRYLHQRALFRERAVTAFENDHPRGEFILEAAGEIVSSRTLFLSDRDLRQIQSGPQIASLIVSYCRTHFIAADLIRQAELIEATTLARKQMELLARVRELETAAPASLEGRTPNLRHLVTKVKRLYDSYSSIAHSAKEEPLRFLGSREREDGEGWNALLYPESDHNAFAAAHTLGLLALEFELCADDFCRRAAPDAPQPETTIVLHALHQALLRY
ncbi:MAG: hypothetical protein IPH07_10015 [Deltaproteobacteria bacterium]|nr:hypothetical protein [Deltaproteobacteria bacterium]MBK8718768.1 hypothetical protein [Deltaproteobacteria bacterium]MBP7286481.1 hypothetical protein [Nannocystaceae bacterium]